MLENKNILIGVSGSIAVYKTLELIRLFIKAKAKVRVIMTPSSTKFITPLTFETISQNKVLIESSESWADDNNHIAIGKWADLFIIAPATANTINKLSHGVADNLLLQTAIAYPRIKLIAPAANTNMLENPITQKSLEKLRKSNFEVLSTCIKELACKDVGNGAMLEPEDIYHMTLRELLKDDYWDKREVILNGGGSIEKIDDIRYISNFSSGKMANSLATSLYYKGANVSLVSSSNAQKCKISQIKNFKVNSAKEMFLACEKLSNEAKIKKGKKPFFFGVAAISDYTPNLVKKGKLKKEDIGKKWNLELKQNIDILNSLDKKGMYTIGFKAEMDKENAKQNALNMLHKKSLNGVCLNIIDEENGFGKEKNNIEFLSLKNQISFELEDKLSLSFKILEQLKKEFNE